MTPEPERKKTALKPKTQGQDQDAQANEANQGEGNREAARRYNEEQKRFVASGQVPAAAGRAAPDSSTEARELEQAEHEGRSHAKGEDPTVPGANAARSSKP
jgi:hypothetical protein